MKSSNTPAPQFQSASTTTNALWNLTSFFITVVISLFLSPLLIHSLGDDEYGVWAIAGQLAVYYAMMGLGARGAIRYWVARYQAESSWDEMARLLNTGFWVLGCAAVVVAAAGIFIAFHFSWLFKTGAVSTNRIRTAVMILSAVVALELPLSVASATLGGARRVDMEAAAFIVGRAIAALAMFFTLLAGGKLVAVALVQASGFVITWLQSWYSVRHLGLPLRPWPPHWTSGTLRNLLTVGGATAIADLAWLLSNEVQLVVVGSLLGTRWVTYFAIGRYLPRYYYTMVATVARAVTPSFTYQRTLNSGKQLAQMFVSASRIIAVFSVFCGISILVFGKAFLTLWVGKQYVSGEWGYRSDAVLLVLTAAMIPTSVFSICYQLLLGIREMRFIAVYRIAEGVAVVTLSLALIGPLHLYGVALAMFVPMAVGNVCFMVPYTLRVLGISVNAYLRSVGLPAFLVTAGTSVLSLSVTRLHPPNSWPFFFGEAALVAVATLCLVWTLVLQKQERDHFRGRGVAFLGALRVRLAGTSFR